MSNAKEHLEKAIQIHPEYADAHYELALLLSNNSEYEKSKEHFLKTIEIRPEFSLAHFNNALLLVLEKYEQIMEIILPTLGKERQKTYSPFLPICPETGQVLEVSVIEIKKKAGKIIYKNGDKKKETEVIKGKCKLQWKVDWAMRWYAFDVDYEMY